MTSGVFELIPTSSIRVAEDRQRREFRDIEDLAASIKSLGLIHPLVVTRDNLLVAGERRLRAIQSLGLALTPVQYADTLDKTELEAIELEENIKRADLTWQEQTNAIARYHRLQKGRHEHWSTQDTADGLNISRRVAERHLAVEHELTAGTSLVMQADAFSTAFNIVKRRAERKRAFSLAALTEDINEVEPETALPPRPIQLLRASCYEWEKTYRGAVFNFIHADPPYGINYHEHDGQGSAHGVEPYTDRPEDYFNFLAWITRTPVVADSAHMILWFAMDHYFPTLEILNETGWRVDKRPLIWGHSDNRGILPDKDRGPRWIYDTALFCSRGDRKIVQAVGNAVWAPTDREFHSSAKPLPVLDHFFRMTVDDSTRLLDPTCGSGMAVKSAEAAGAAFSLGIEISEENFENAERNLGLRAPKEE